MTSRSEARKVETLDALAALATQRLGGNATTPPAVAEEILRRFYANVAPEDIETRNLDDLFGAAIALWQFARQRENGQPKVRVYNPRLDENGWSSPHTVIEIVHDDMPFLVDTIAAELGRQDVSVHLLVHPILTLKRDAAGIAEIDGGGRRESLMHIEIDAQGDAAARTAVQRGVESVLADVRACVADWKEMMARCHAVIDELGSAPPASRPEAEVRTARDFLSWLAADNFTFLGYREYLYSGDDGAFKVDIAEGRGLGLMRRQEFVAFDVLRDAEALPRLQQFVRAPELMRVVKANRRSTVHRTAYLDAIGIKTYDAGGRVVGERLFLGLFTSSAYMTPPAGVPLLRDKVAAIKAGAGLGETGHAAKALQHVLDTFPRDELFQSSVDELRETAIGIVRLQERRRIALFLRRDPFDRFVSALVFCPRDRYTSDLRRRFHEIIARAFDGRQSAYYTQLADDSALVRLHLIVGTKPGHVPDVRPDRLEQQLVDAARSFADRLRDALIAAEGEAHGLPKLRRYQDAFPVAYREIFPPEQAVLDIQAIDRILAGDRALAITLYRTVQAAVNELGLRLYHRGEPVPLSEILPMLENMGLKVLTEDPFKINVATDPVTGSHETVYLHDITMTAREARDIDLGLVKPAFEEALSLVWSGDAASDGFNRLVLGAAMTMTEVRVLRSYAAFLRQAGIPFSQSYMEDTLARNPRIARKLVDLFLARHDPRRGDADRAAADEALTGDILRLLDEVANLDEDRILRRFLNAVQSTLRTNHFQHDAQGQPKAYLSIKFDSQKLEELPLPRPLVEVFVYSPRVEAVHLRGGKVARGGIRWSDRREDFRTEILGLIKAQMVKNAVIVPVGSKGGFFVKKPPPAEAGRDAFLKEGIECYKIFMRGLLDITDNLAPSGIVPPKDVVRHDGDDPYLVVAADKGTATFSDIANAISIEYGHWLGDAFASGGSAGYDHKAMGITARGAWEAVKRHFREIGTDIQTTDFTVVGVGDMSGDVFGNGMLLSRHIKLVAAFDHRHIFVDPTPDPARAWTERDRLFRLPRSSWADYDAGLISAGGGVFDRKAKSIAITAEMKAAFGITAAHLAPNDLIRAILKATVDLLWFGGIGNYVKASSESHAEAGDRANDALRIDGAEVRAKVIGEGANLGCTQRGRIEYALAGGRINTDAIDNSAGVDTSDHEVNIKILLGDVVARGDMTLKQRDVLLAEMTEELGHQVLRDNYLQTQALSLAEAEGAARIESYGRMMRALERTGRLNRAVEYLPDDVSLAERAQAGRGLTRPELAVLLAYAKMALYDELLASDLPDDPALQDDLVKYFPRPLRKRFLDAILRHGLRREIIATVVTNSIVNRTGITFVTDMKEATGLPAADITRAYLAAREIFDLRPLWGAVEQQDNKVPTTTQSRMLRSAASLVEHGTHWLLRHVGAHGPIAVAPTIERFGPGIGKLGAGLWSVLDPVRAEAFSARSAAYITDGVPNETARAFAGLTDLTAALDLVRAAETAATEVTEVARAYYLLGARLGFDWLLDAAGQVPARTPWQKRAMAAVVGDLYAQQAELVGRVLTGAAAGCSIEATAEAWIETHRTGVARVDALLAELKSGPQVDLAALTVIGRELRAVIAG